MINSNSPAYKFSEKVGKGIRYIVIGVIVVFIGGKLGGSTPPLAPPAPPP